MILCPAIFEVGPPAMKWRKCTRNISMFERPCWLALAVVLMNSKNLIVHLIARVSVVYSSHAIFSSNFLLCFGEEGSNVTAGCCSAMVYV